MPEAKRVKNRVHLDLVAVDVEAEIRRLNGLGATVQARHTGHVVLADPDTSDCRF